MPTHELVVESGIPCPPKANRPAYREMLAKMQVGDSVFFEKESRASSFAITGRRIGYRLTRRAVKETRNGRPVDGIRVWLEQKP